jgi:F-type H+-transporting ATPase subunit delta
MSLAVANRYARALIDVVLEPASELDPRQVVAQLQSLEDVVAEFAELRNILLSPAVPLARKRAVLARLLETLSVSPLVRNFVFVVIDRRRILLLKEIRQAFETLLDERQSVVRADISSAGELSGPQRDRLREEISTLTGKRVRCEFAVEDSLLGGAVVKVGSSIYDGSLRGQLEAMRQRLLG